MLVADMLAQILLGVHGNGLTALLWMKVTPRSTVLEFFYPGGFAHDYDADAPPVAYPEGFQGNEIPIDGEVVAQLVHRRLSLAEEADD